VASLSTTVIVGLRAALKIADVSAVQSRFVGERFLRPTLFLAQQSQILRKALPNIHRGNSAGMSAISLQTISDKSFDHEIRATYQCHL
jgi:hypothetical protein